MSVFSSVRVVFRQPCRSFRAYKTQTVATTERTVEDEVRTSVKGREEPLSGEEWSELRNRVLKYRRVCTPVNVDATILGLCQRHGSVEMGQSYVRFLEEKEIPLTAAIAGKYLKLFSLDKGEATLSPAESSEVLRVCGIIREKHPVLDSTTAENLIYALCLTSEWKESLELLEQVKVFGQPSHAAFNDIAQAAFRNCCPEKGVSILEEGICGGRLPYAASLIAWIDSGDLEGMLTFLQRHNLQIPESVATALKKHLEQSRKIPVTMSSVSRNKVCGSCRTRLDEVTVEKDEFRKLRDAFHEKVLIKDNIFIKSTPQEFNEFQQFLDRTGPFDVVIDGLNVAYSVGANRPVNHLAGHILAAMKHFAEEDKRVLILGREHMKRWPSFIKRIQTNNGEVFLTENLTQDDPFFIYAALHSGPHCDIFTRDLLRTHAHQLGPELGAIFRKWQRIHQFSYKSPTSSATPRIFVQPPIKYKIEAHRNSSGHWHVPWTEGGAEYAVGRLPEVPFEVPIRWLCFRSNRSQL